MRGSVAHSRGLSASQVAPRGRCCQSSRVGSGIRRVGPACSAPPQTGLSTRAAAQVSWPLHHVSAPRRRNAQTQGPLSTELPNTSRYPTHRSTAAVLPNLAPLPLYYFLPYADWHCQTCTAHAKPWRETVEAGGTIGLRLPNDQ